MLTQEEIVRLSRLERLKNPIVSFYLNLSPEVTWKKILSVSLKDLMKEGKEQIERLKLAKEEQDFLAKDLTRIENYLKDFTRNKELGLALFSQTRNGIFHVYPVHRPLPDRIVIDYDIHINPLVNLVQQYKRYCVVLVNQKRARILEFFLGFLEDRMEIIDTIPKRVNTGGYRGYEGKRRERHVDEGVHHHLKNVADCVFEFFKKYQFSDLILGGENVLLAIFESVLHSYLKERIAGRILVSPEANLSEITEAAMRIENEHKKKRDQELARELQVATFKQSSGILGLEGTLDALSRGHVHRLLVHENFSRPGMECKSCGFLRIDGSMCPICSKPLEPARDIINQAVEHALQQKAEVRHISQDIPLAEGIGAFLRFRVGTTELEAGDVKENKNIIPRSRFG